MEKEYLTHNDIIEAGLAHWYLTVQRCKVLPEIQWEATQRRKAFSSPFQVREILAQSLHRQLFHVLGDTLKPICILNCS